MSVLRWAALPTLIMGLACGSDASAATAKILYSFCIQAGCTDGQAPRGNLVTDASGDIFGVTASGGDSDSGVVFELVHDAQSGTWTYQRIYSFCSAMACPDGIDPIGSLVIDTQGRLYGVTTFDGAFSFGTLYRLAPSHGSWTYKVLADFCMQANCTDTGSPSAGLSYKGQASGMPYDGTSPLYGVTEAGGATNKGVVFEATPGRKKNWKVSTIYNFCSLPSCADGGLPEARMTLDDAGDIVGIASFGGENPFGGGTVFRLSSKNGHKWKEKTLHSFCALDQCADGGSSNQIGFDAKGDILGTTVEGGTNGKGVLFRLNAGGKHQTYAVLYDFCAKPNCSDGAVPEGPVTLDASGNMFGTTTVAGTWFNDPFHQGGGTIFEFSHNHYRTLADFCSQADCADGGFPWNALLPDGSGNYFGVAEIGGAGHNGTIFELTP